MVKRTLSIFALLVLLILGISLLFLGPDEDDANLTDSGSAAVEARDDAATGSELDRDHPNYDYTVRDDFAGYFSKTNPATGENYSEKEVSALQYLFDKFPLNDFVNSLLNPDAQEEKKKHLYALAEKIQTGRATEEEITEYYAHGEKDILDKMEVLSELGDREQADRQRAELQDSLREMYRTRDALLNQARNRAPGDQP